MQTLLNNPWMFVWIDEIKSVANFILGIKRADLSPSSWLILKIAIVICFILNGASIVYYY